MPPAPVRPRPLISLRLFAALSALVTLGLLGSGCTPLREYIHNGFKVGPNYGRPPAPVAEQWIDASDQRVRTETDDLSKWWTVFNDPALNNLMCFAYNQNLSLRAAGFRVLEARAQLAIDAGNLLPQTQQATGDYTRTGLSKKTVLGSFIPVRWYSQWDFGFNLSWELDFWGRFRRAVESDAAALDASVDSYDDVLVTLLGDVATNYVLVRTYQERIRYAKTNIEVQTETLKITEARLKAGTVSELDVAQARSTLEQTQAILPVLEISLRQTNNLLCILLGIPPEDLLARIGTGPIPTAPPDVVVGIPADLLRRRPDVRKAERLAAAQSAQIGIAEAEFYPHISITGTVGYSAEQFKDVFSSQAFNGTIGPTLRWNVLNYGRILNNVRLQDAKFQELIATYQNTVLTAQQEVENGIVTFLKAQVQTKYQQASVTDAEKAVRISISQYKAGTTDFTRVTLLEQNLVPVQDVLAQAQGSIATGLVQVYKALGGGWQIRCKGSDACTPEMRCTLGTPQPTQPAQPAGPTTPVNPLTKTPQANVEPAPADSRVRFGMRAGL